MRSKEFECGFDKQRGVLTTLEFGGKPLLAAPLVPNFWRAITDNDRRGGQDRKLPRDPWRVAFAQAKPLIIDAQQQDKQSAKVVCEYELPSVAAKVTTIYTVRAGGKIDVHAELDLTEKSPPLPRFGMTLGLTVDFDQISFYGRGPHENYWDRKTGSAPGQYEMPLSEVAYDYVRPQENGNREDCRLLKLSSASGRQLRVIGRPIFSFNAWPYTLETLDRAKHTTDLEPAGYTTLNIDYRQRGVGGDDSWSPHAAALPQYQLTKDHYEFDFRLAPTMTSTKPKIE